MRQYCGGCCVKMHGITVILLTLILCICATDYRSVALEKVATFQSTLDFFKKYCEGEVHFDL